MPALYERAALGDLDDRMQLLRHGPERAFANAPADLADMLEPLSRHLRPGTRQWALRELGILRQPRSVSALKMALADPERIVRDEALMSLQMHAQADEQVASWLNDVGLSAG